MGDVAASIVQMLSTGYGEPGENVRISKLNVTDVLIQKLIGPIAAPYETLRFTMLLSHSENRVLDGVIRMREKGENTTGEEMVDDFRVITGH